MEEFVNSLDFAKKKKKKLLALACHIKWNFYVYACWSEEADNVYYNT